MSNIRKYDINTQKTNRRHRENEPHNNYKTYKRQKKKNSQLSFAYQYVCKTRPEKSSVQQIMNQTQNPEKRQTINNESTTTKPPPA